MSGIGYRQMGYFLRGEMSLPEAVEILKRDTRRYAKRQMTWFKRDERINWVKDVGEAEKLVSGFLVK
jgi:tRNA dimethylallyltransferase